MGKALFVCQYAPYQYEQFKLLIDQLDVDVYYKSNLQTAGRTLPKEVIYDLDGNPYTLDDIEKKGYDYLIYTGNAKNYIEHLAKRTKFHYTVYLSHSLMGTQYDVSISMPYYERSIGIMPSLWTKFDSFEHVKYLWKLRNRSWKFIEVQSNPIVAQVLSTAPKVEMDKNSMGIILGEKNPFETSRDLVLNTKERLGLGSLYIKFHPLTDKKDRDFFTPNNFTVLDTHSPKYDFTDRCEFLVGGASSLLIEACMRNAYFQLGQKYAKFAIKRGVDIDLDKIDKFNPQTSPDLTTYDSLIMSPEEIIKEHIATIEFIEKNYI